MYFIEHLCDMAQRENHLDFVRMMQRDILRVVDAVAPSDGSGAANVKVVRRVGSTFPTVHMQSKPTVTDTDTAWGIGTSRPTTKVRPPPGHRH